MLASRRIRLASLLAAVLVPGFAQAQQASNYPDRPVQVVVSWAAGGSVDSIARALAQSMSEHLGQPHVVVNRDGAAGQLGSALIAKATPDGYLTNFGPITPITNALHLMKARQFSLESFEYVCQVFENMFGVGVPENSPITSMEQLIKAIKDNPGKMTYGHLGRGSLSHLAFANIAHKNKLEVTEVPYRGENALMPDLMAARIDFGIVTAGGMVGKPVRILGMFSDRRHPAFANVATMPELGMPSLQPALNGILVPKGTPEPILARIEDGCRKGTESASFKEFMNKMQQPIVFLDRKQFTQAAHADNKEKADLIALLGIEPQ